MEYLTDPTKLFDSNPRRSDERNNLECTFPFGRANDGDGGDSAPSKKRKHKSYIPDARGWDWSTLADVLEEASEEVIYSVAPMLRRQLCFKCEVPLTSPESLVDSLPAHARRRRLWMAAAKGWNTETPRQQVLLGHLYECDIEAPIEFRDPELVDTYWKDILLILAGASLDRTTNRWEDGTKNDAFQSQMFPQPVLWDGTPASPEQLRKAQLHDLENTSIEATENNDKWCANFKLKDQDGSAAAEQGHPDGSYLRCAAELHDLGRMPKATFRGIMLSPSMVLRFQHGLHFRRFFDNQKMEKDDSPKIRRFVFKSRDKLGVDVQPLFYDEHSFAVAVNVLRMLVEYNCVKAKKPQCGDATFSTILPALKTLRRVIFPTGYYAFIDAMTLFPREPCRQQATHVSDRQWKAFQKLGEQDQKYARVLYPNSYVEPDLQPRSEDTNTVFASYKPLWTLENADENFNKAYMGVCAFRLEPYFWKDQVYISFTLGPTIAKMCSTFKQTLTDTKSVVEVSPHTYAALKNETTTKDEDYFSEDEPIDTYVS